MLLATVLTVFAAASLHNAMPALARDFSAANPGVEVRFDFDGSQVLETQLAQGAHADVFVSADARWMTKALDAKLVVNPALFAHNRLVVIASRDSPVRSLRDLARDGTKIVACAEAVPCGRYTRQTLHKMAADAAFGRAYAAAVTRNIVSLEANVEGVVAKIALGEADAGFVYATDAAAMRYGAARTLELPPADRASASYFIARTTVGDEPDAALRFVAFARSARGQAILARYAFER